MPRRVPAPDVLHVYRPHRLGSIRGKPWGAPALNKAEGLKTYGEAEIEPMLENDASDPGSIASSGVKNHLNFTNIIMEISMIAKM